MEEISSLDSFHTDGGDSAPTPRQETPTPKLDVDKSSKNVSATSTSTSAKNTEDQGSSSSIKNVTEDAGGGTEDDDALANATNDEDFEQISDGTFEVDENSQETSTDRPLPSAQDDGDGDEEYTNEKNNDVEETEEQPSTPLEDEKAESEEGETPNTTTHSNTDGGAQDSQTNAYGDEDEEEQEMEANESTSSKDKTGEEKDVFGDTEHATASPSSTTHQGSGDVVDAAPFMDNSNAMDVDEEGEDVSALDAPTNDGGDADAEMQSAHNSPQRRDDGDDDDVSKEGANNSNLDEGRDEVDNEAHETSEANEKHTRDATGGDEIGEGEDEEGNAGEQLDDDAEHDDEPVENVQEPEESDVCLIPDDTETQVTQAEKDQAILARENAEKQEQQEEEEAAAEKAAETDAASLTAAAAAASTMTTSTSDNQERHSSTEFDKDNADADAQAKKQAGAEADAAGNSGEENINAEGAEPNENDDQLPEESSTLNEAGAVAKIIIGWVVSTMQKCKQCGEEKSCGFRYKTQDEYEYICEQTCCDALLADHPGKYFIRRKKFLVEELNSSNEETNEESTTEETETDAPVAEDDETSKDKDITEPTDGADGDEDEKSTKSKLKDEKTKLTKKAASSIKEKIKHLCIHCKERRECKYFIKQDHDTFYVCNDDCFNLLNIEEPDKYKLKRHSIRVIDIAATISTNAAANAPTTTTTIESAATKKTNESCVRARTSAEAEAARLERLDSFRRRCAECHTDVIIGEKHLLWETMDFCNELCLGKYQRKIGSKCQTCSGEVSQTALGKYCVRFGFDVRQFCCAACLNVFKKGLKTCSCCQKDISAGNEGFLAPVGDKEQFKDFCSQACLRRYDNMCNPKKKPRNDICNVCNNEKPVRVEMSLDDKEHYFCSNPCFSAFKFVSNVDADQCGMCCKYFERKAAENFTIYSENEPKVFCSRICINVYIIVNRHIVSCQWCKVKKYNFDMIYKTQDEHETLTCSLTCLSMYGVSVKAFSRAVTKCDQCDTATTPQYHLTMSDASIRNFCTYQCVMQFQNQFARVPLTLENEQPSTSSTTSSKSGNQEQNSTHSSSSSNSYNKNGAPFPTGLPKRVKLKYSTQQKLKQGKMSSVTVNNKKGGGVGGASSPVVPVISNVTSLASGETEAMLGGVSTGRRGRGRSRKIESPPPLLAFSRGGRPRKFVDYTTGRSPSPITTTLGNSNTRRSSVAGSGTGASVGASAVGGSVGVPTNDYAAHAVTQTETKIITLPPYPPTVRNVCTSCKPQTVTVGFQTAPKTAEIGIQTDKDYSNKVLIPVPVPIYVPQPMYMYSAPFPVPVPIPLPIPVPIFVPTTRNSAQGILKEIKKIQERIPTDPLEAELLMMAEMVAEEKHDSDSDSDNEIKPDPALVQLQYNNSLQQQQQQQQEVVVSSNNSYNEDVLQMALKMATGDYEQQPTVDLESAMTANTITNPPPGMVSHDNLGHMNVHQLDQHHMLETQRPGRGRKRAAVVAVSPSVASPSRNNRSPVKRQRMQDLDSPIQQSALSPQQPTEKPDANMCLKYTFGVNAWKQWVMTKNADIEKSSMRRRTFKTDLLQMTADELNFSLCLFVKEVRKPNGTEYAPDTIYYLVLGIQQYLYVNGRIDNIFYDPYYERFTECLDEVARKFSVLYNDSQYIVTRVEEEHLWECKQLGAHSPHVLLSTLMFFNTKHFNLTTVEEHMQLSFSHIMKHWKRSAQNAKLPGSRNVLLRFYPPQTATEANPRKKKVYEQQENEENPLRCPVRLYEFYLSKCPESVKTRNDVFYLQPERSCVPDSPVWYSTQALSQDSLQRMLHRVKMVKEINIALLTS